MLSFSDIFYQTVGQVTVATAVVIALGLALWFAGAVLDYGLGKASVYVYFVGWLYSYVRNYRRFHQWVEENPKSVEGPKPT